MVFTFIMLANAYNVLSYAKDRQPGMREMNAPNDMPECPMMECRDVWYANARNEMEYAAEMPSEIEDDDARWYAQ